MLDVWPTLPLVIKARVTKASVAVANVINMLGDSNHVCQIDLTVTTPQLEEVLAAMGVPFPELTVSVYRTAPDAPDSFLGGSAPRLRLLHWIGFHFWG